VARRLCSDIATTDLMYWEMYKLLELGVRDGFFVMHDSTQEQLQDMLKGLLHLREKYPEFWHKSDPTW
jgi:hypothetical protein